MMENLYYEIKKFLNLLKVQLQDENLPELDKC